MAKAGSPKTYDDSFKILVIGDSGVGKSCLLLRFADNTYGESFIATIGVDFRFRTLKIDNKDIKLQIWDTAGQERFRLIAQSYYRGAHGIIVVFDVTSKDSFDNIPKWLFEIEKCAKDNICKILLGNKVDCNDNEREVTFAEGKELANDINVKYFETSAKDSINVNNAFEQLTRDILEKEQEKRKNINGISGNNNNNNNNNNSSNGGFIDVHSVMNGNYYHNINRKQRSNGCACLLL